MGLSNCRSSHKNQDYKIIQVNGEDDKFLSLPSHIIIDILSRLSTKTLSRCRCACKIWWKLISGPEFSSFRILIPPTTSLMIQTNSNSSFNLVELEDEPNSHDFYYVPGTKFEQPLKGLGENCMSMFGSVNGLISLQRFGYQIPDTVYIWNPATQESITVQSAGGVMVFPNVITFGFRLSSKAGEYKVARIYQEVLEENLLHVIRSDCHVYTHGSERRWRYTGHAPFLYTCREHGVFLNGNLHWWIRDPDGKEFISCFDLDKESFQHFPAPPELDELNLASLELYQDRLSVCDNTSDFDIVIWVMKEYGVKKSWFKQFVIDKHPIDLVGQYYEVVRILKVFRDGEILLIWRDDLLISFNSKTNSLQRIDTNRFLCGSDQESFPGIEAVNYASSFLSLRRFKVEMVKDTFKILKSTCICGIEI